MGVNQFLPFAPTDISTNLLTNAQYLAASDRTNGNQPGVASSKLNNKALRQSSYITSQIAQYLADRLSVDVLDDDPETPATLLAQMVASFSPVYPQLQQFLSGTGTYGKSYVFTIASGNATVGATYTNNSTTFTVVATVSSSTQVIMKGPAAPLPAGTLTKTGGTGDSTITFFAVRAPLYLGVKMIGGGGGGAGSGSSAAGAGVDGIASSFVSTNHNLTANGGGGAPLGVSGNAFGGAGGTGSITGPHLMGSAFTGNEGGSTVFTAGISFNVPPGAGAGTVFGGSPTGNTFDGGTNSGAGGTGGSAAATGVYGGGGGGAGCLIEAIIQVPDTSYTYTVGGGGGGGAGGVSGSPGGTGGSGRIIITEYYQ